MPQPDPVITLALETTAASWQEDQAFWSANLKDGNSNVVVMSTTSIRRTGAGLREAAFVEPVSVLMTISVAIITKRVIDHWLIGREQGVQIDLRDYPPTVSCLANVPRGFIVLIDKQGKAKTDKIAYDKGEQLSSLIESYLLDKPAEE